MRANWIVAAALLSLTLYGCGGRQQTEQPEPEPATAVIAPAPIDTRPVIVAFGDSLTAGYGVEPGKSYPDFLQRRLDAAGYKYHVVNLGVSGDTTTDGIQRIPEVLAAKPELVILEFGGNDGLRGLPVSTTRANLTQMIQSLQKAKIQILLAGMTLPRNYGSAYIHSFEKVYA
ncbi:MAG TPA: arylesterase, partial [Bryobacteraceae bacterium]|nr:arylesterase [Bryobacteraceae bacterium]